MTEKLKMCTPDLTQANIEKIAELFPNVITEIEGEDGKPKKGVDFDLLKQALSDVLVEDENERYRLDWPGKKKSLLKANTPINKTLRPCREESVNFDTTENLYIEGDNFEVLKILQESYLGKVKMIYIDPPYNRGDDLIYKDDFKVSTEEYEEELGVYDDDGGKLFKNTDSNGRFHSDWLSMMYERLVIAKDLLEDNGVIFISLDDNEVHNLRKICDEIFGEKNFVGAIIWNNVTDNNPTNIATEHEYIICYCKDKVKLAPFWKSNISEIKDLLVNIGEEIIAKYKTQDEMQLAYSKWFRENKNQLKPFENYKFIDEGGVYSGERGVHNPGKEGYRYDVIHPTTLKPCKQPLMGYRFPKETMDQMIQQGRIIFGDDEDKLVEIKVYAKDYLQKLSSVLQLDGRTGANELKELFPSEKKVFTNPKTIKLLSEIVSFTCNENDLVLDFFSGSASTAHAIMQLNAEDGMNRKFILVQLSENTPKDSEAYKSGYKTIAEIGKERIRRVGKKILKELEPKNQQLKLGEEAKDASKLDVGFRVYKLDSTNMQDVYYHPNQVNQEQLSLSISNVKEGRTAEDLLTQVILDLGLELNLPIEHKNTHGNNVYYVQNNSLVACFDESIDFRIIDEIAKAHPLRVVFKDSGFRDDKDRINLEERFKRLSPETQIRVI